MNYQFDRRDFLRGAMASSAVLLAARAQALTLSPERLLPPVKVSRDRVIREVVGLRPFRSEGFVVEAQRAGNKKLIHNYGHGGGGMTLSWGTATLAIELAREVLASTARTTRPANNNRRFAVLGSGVSGLSTARLLQRYFDGGVTIYAKDLPPNTTSNIAGAHWSPTTVFDPESVSPKFNEQFRRACRLSNRAFQLLVSSENGVRWIDTFILYRNPPAADDELPGGNDLYPGIEVHHDPDRYFGSPYVKQFSTMLIEPSIYLAQLLRDFYIAGGRVVVKEFHNREEIMRLPEPVVFNCTGLGARALFNDEKLGPVRGQLEVLLPQPEIDYCYLSRGYMFPRRDGIILGGTFDHDDWSLEPRADQAAGILEVHAQINKGLKPV